MYGCSDIYGAPGSDIGARIASVLARSKRPSAPVGTPVSGVIRGRWEASEEPEKQPVRPLELEFEQMEFATSRLGGFVLASIADIIEVLDDLDRATPEQLSRIEDLLTTYALLIVDGKTKEAARVNEDLQVFVERLLYGYEGDRSRLNRVYGNYLDMVKDQASDWESSFGRAIYESTTFTAQSRPGFQFDTGPYGWWGRRPGVLYQDSVHGPWRDLYRTRYGAVDAVVRDAVREVGEELGLIRTSAPRSYSLGGP